MLAIRMQRTGRSGHAQFRVIVQDSRAHPKGGRVVAYLGNYDPHTKVAQLDTEKIGSYLNGGAQPSDRVAKLLKKEGVKLPAWVVISPDKKRAIRQPEKLRRNAPPGEKPEPAAQQPIQEPSGPAEVEQPAAEATGPEGEERAETPAKEEAPAEEVAVAEPEKEIDQPPESEPPAET